MDRDTRYTKKSLERLSAEVLVLIVCLTRRRRLNYRDEQCKARLLGSKLCSGAITKDQHEMRLREFEQSLVWQQAIAARRQAESGKASSTSGLAPLKVYLEIFVIIQAPFHLI